MDTQQNSIREKILDSSLKLFSERGFKATTMRDIASDIGIRQGGIYNYFKSKEEILETFINEMIESKIFTLIDNEDINNPQYYKRGKLALLDIALKCKSINLDSRSEALFRLIMQELFRNQKIRDLYYENFYQRNIKKISVLFFQMIKDNIIHPRDPLMLATEFLSPLLFFQIQIILLKIDNKSTSVAIMLFEKHVDSFWESIENKNFNNAFKKLH